MSKTGVCLVFFLFQLFILYFFKHGIVHCLTKEEEIKKGLLTSHNITTHLILDFCLDCGYCLGRHLVGGLLSFCLGVSTEAHHVAQVGLELLNSRNPCALASLVDRTPTIHHYR